MRICGVLKIALREDDPGTFIRLAPEDVKGETVQGQSIQPGLYQCSRDAFEKFAPRVIERLKRTPALGHDGKPIFTNGTYTERAMILPETATVENTPPRMLM